MTSSAQAENLDQPPSQSGQQTLPQSGQPLPEGDQPLLQAGQSLPQSDQALLQSDRHLHQEKSHPQGCQPLHQSDRNLHQDKSLHQASRPLHQSDRNLHQEKSLSQASRPLHQSDRPFLQSDQPLPEVGQPLHQSDRPFPYEGRSLFKSDQPLTRSNLPRPLQPANPFPHESQPLLPAGQPQPQSNLPHPQAGQPTSQMDAVPRAGQTVVFNPDELKRLRREQLAKAFKIIGALQIAFGIAEVLLGFVAIVMQGWFSYFATPVWVGLLFFITTGMLSRNSARKKEVRAANLIMFIITASIAFALLSLSTFMAKAEDTRKYNTILYEKYGITYLRPVLSNVCNPGTSSQTDEDCKQTIIGRKIVDSLIGLVALIEGVLAIVGASLCCSTMCRGCCGTSTSSATTTAHYTTSTTGYAGDQTLGHKYSQVPQRVMPDGKTVAHTNQGVPMYVAQEGYSMVPQSQYASSGALSQKSQTRGYNDATLRVTQPKPAPSSYSPNYFSGGPRGTKASEPEYM